MKMILPFLFCLCGFAFAAENDSSFDASKEKELQWMFEKDFLNAEDTQDFLYLQASKIIEEQHHTVSPDELIKQFKALTHTPEVQRKFLTIYDSIFDAEEKKQLSKLLQNKYYLALRQKMGQAFMQCFFEMKAVLEELATTIPKTAVPKARKDIQHLHRGNIEELLGSDHPLVVDVYTDWCGPCKAIAPIIEELNQELGHLYQFVKLDGEQEVELADAFQIRSYPTLLFIKNGKVVGRFHGFMSKSKLLTYIKHHFE